MPKDDWLKVAILYDKNARYTPSNYPAIDLFCESALRCQIYPTIIGKADIDILDGYDGLFIRDTTHPGSYTYEFATYMEMLGKKVIDNTQSISQGCNKVWQIEQFRENNINHPFTWFDTYIFHPYYYVQAISAYCEFPCVIKIPDSCFSQGVYKCNNVEEYKEKLKEISKITHTKLVCQKFIETKFDWRICIFNHKFLFACKYYMVDGDWKIVKYDRKGEYIDGKHECVRYEDIPPHVLVEALKCDKFLTDGLYGIDIKEIDGVAYVIEINDNPSIDAGVEDEIESLRIYDTIMQWYRTP